MKTSRFARLGLILTVTLLAGLAWSAPPEGETPTTTSAAPQAAAPMSGIVVDDDAAELTGTWIESTKQPALVGDGYRHDNNQNRGQMSARFTPELPAAGQYEVRLLYPANRNRSTRTQVTVHGADGDQTVTVNQREEPMADGLARALGTFSFAAGKTGWVTIVNDGADGYVAVDGVQFVPFQVAEAERRAAKKPKTVRLLTVGNSFSGNATRYLNDLAKAAGNVLVHHPAAIGGGTMAQHCEKAEYYDRDAKDERGLYLTRKNLRQELSAEPWDFVTIQQASIRSHDLSTYRPYAIRLYDYIKKLAPQAEVLVHQTWAYRVDDPRFGKPLPEPGEPKTQQEMYEGLTRAYETIAAELGSRIIPCGDALYMADTDATWGYKPDKTVDPKKVQPPSLPDQTHSLHTGWRWAKQKDGKLSFGMDGHHANMAGQYLGACTFYEVMFGESVVGNPFVPEGLDPAYARFLQETAHKAIQQRQSKKPIPVGPAASVSLEEVDGKQFDLVVVGGTPGGIACAVRAAREGLNVLLVNHIAHLGGFMTSGAGGWEAPYDGLRSPLYAEMRTGAAEFYRAHYGEGSQQHRASLPDPNSNAHIARPKIEPRIAELLFNRMVAREKSLVVLSGFYVTAAERDGTLLKSLALRELRGDRTCRVRANVFADGSYEGDLAAAAKVPYYVGREARKQYNEPHAGVVYTKPRHPEPGQRGFPKDADEGRLKIRSNGHGTSDLDVPENTGEADAAVMAYNYRLILTKDPANRVEVPTPADKDPGDFRGTLSRSIVPNLPNGKIAWNGGGRLVGPQNDYPDGDWPTRERISRQYLDAALKALWLVQNASDVPESERAFWKDYGLAKDEFPHNGHVPYEVYVREARRIVGRHVFTEHDGVMAPGIARTPMHADSVAITDWPLDSVACVDRKVRGSNVDGVVFLGEESRPAQVPYRSLLPQGVDNLLVPVALSASHIGWGCIRLEPVWMQTGEAAGFAAAMAIQGHTTPGQLDGDRLLGKLVKSRVTVSFFNDVDVTSDEPWVPAVQYFGTKGFFASYDAGPAKPLSAATARCWGKTFGKLLGSRNIDATAQARELAAAETPRIPR